MSRFVGDKWHQLRFEIHRFAHGNEVFQFVCPEYLYEAEKHIRLRRISRDETCRQASCEGAEPTLRKVSTPFIKLRRPENGQPRFLPISIIKSSA